VFELDVELLNHSPSFSIRLLISSEDLALGFGSYSFSGAVLSDVRRYRAEGGLGVLKLSTDEILLFTEWPRMVDMELSVSDEMVESGRGMYSILSEKPTLGRDGGRGSTASGDDMVVGSTGSLVTSGVNSDEGSDAASSR